MSDWTLCGWRVRSDIALPEALPWQGDPDRPVDVHVRLGDVPAELPGAVPTEVMSSVGPDGTYLFRMGRVARYLVRGGNEIVVAPVMAPDEPDVRLFVETNCLAALAFQRGLIALHGSVVRVDGRTIEILGSSGQGKSTMAAMLAARGHAFLAEDVCALDDTGPAGAAPLVVPTLPNIRLWRDALDAMGIDAGPLVQSRRHLQKFHLVRPDWFHDRPEPLTAVVILQETAPPLVPSGVRQIRGVAALRSINRQLLRPTVAEVLGFEKRVVSVALALAQKGRIFEFGTVRDKTRFAEGAERIEALCRDLAP